ncbi:MAG: B12-binding domain-containing radical SAM protein [Candidatus Omnitrophica bacterium]|nr:B12-binding domain-containing radical SAM protein [Candidatus Omnitrophota bacterium]
MRLLFSTTSHELLGVEYLSAVLKRAGHTTGLAYEVGLDGTFYFPRGGKRDHSGILKKIKSFKPDMVLFSTTTNFFPWVKEVAGAIKEHYSVPVIVGGIHPTVCPERTISEPAIDMICLGEGEEALVELADKMERKRDFYDTKNFWFKTEDAVIKNDLRPLIQDLDALPFPDKDLFHSSGFPMQRIYIQTSRGCPYRCPYCYNHQLQNLYKGGGKYYRRRSVKSVIEEFLHYKNKYGSRSVFFYDNTFNYGDDWFWSFLDEYKSRVGLPFSCFVRPDRINRAIARGLKEAGCRWVYIGLESGNDRIRQAVLRRNISSEQIKEAVRIFKENGIKTVTFNMFGLPEESPAEMLDTARLNLDLKPDAVATFTFYPFPETDLMQRAVELKYVDDKIYEKIMTGEGSWTELSILNHPHKIAAYNIKTILPVLNKLPRFLHKYFLDRWIYRRHSGLLLSFIKIISLPFIHSTWETKSRIKEQFGIYLHHFTAALKGKWV